MTATIETYEQRDQEIYDFKIEKGFDAEKVVHIFLFICASLATLIVFFIIVFLFSNVGNFFRVVSLDDFLFEEKWLPTDEDDPEFGARNIIAGTLLVTFGAMLIAVPLGILTAIFIAEIATPKISKFLKAAVELLSGVPSVVFGFFGILILNVWIKEVLGAPQGATWLSGSIILAIMALPTITSVTEDAISSVPRHYREASLAMGATKWQTISKVVLPAAISGITAAIILGMGRAIGETMAVLMVTGNSNVFPDPITDIFSPIRTITGTIGIEMGEVPANSLHYRALFALAIILFFMTFIINITSNLIISRFNKNLRGEKTKKSKFKSFIPKIIKDNKDFIKYILIILLYSWLLSKLFEPVFVIIISLILIGTITVLRIISPFKLEEYKIFIFSFMFIVLISWVFSTWFGWENSILISIAFAGFFIILMILNSVNQQRVMFGIISLAAFISVISLTIIIYYIVSNGLPAITWEFLTESPRYAGREGGIFPAIIGTLWLTVGAIIYAVPIGMAAGIYLSEYAKDGRIAKIIRIGIDNLNGTPSIVFGLFGLAFFVLYLDLGISMIAGQLTLALMILPTIIRTTEEAVKGIPQSFREGSLALGSTKWQSISKVVLPAAMPGITTGVILGMGRASGETAPILFTSVVFQQKNLPRFVIEPVMALTFHLFVLATAIPGAKEQAAGTALVLLVLVIILYGIAIYIRNNYQKKINW
jgi:phosphate transport system permease protein